MIASAAALNDLVAAVEDRRNLAWLTEAAWRADLDGIESDLREDAAAADWLRGDGQRTVLDAAEDALLATRKLGRAFFAQAALDKETAA